MSIGGGARYRLDGRTPGQMRPVNIQMDVQKWATASLIWKQGSEAGIWECLKRSTGF